jgi:hypothetical protein
MAGLRGYPRLENGSSTFGVVDLPDDVKKATMELRSDWKFYALSSFCYTFRAVLRLPEFTGDQLGACGCRLTTRLSFALRVTCLSGVIALRIW